MIDIEQDSEAVLHRFNKLIQELLKGALSRNTFHPWEIELLLDIEACQFRPGSRREMLRRYQKAVQRAMDAGDALPFKMSEYMAGTRGRRRSTPEGTPADTAVNEEVVA